MDLMRKAAMILIAAVWPLLAATAVGGSAAKEPLFKIAISTTAQSYLFGEQVFLDIAVSNPTDRPLRYMSVGDHRRPSGVFIAYVDFKLLKDGEEHVPSDEVPTTSGPWGPVDWVKSRVYPLDVGRTIRSRISLTKQYGLLPAGEYVVRAALSQPQTEFGLTRGEAASNEVRFRVNAWKAAASVVKRMTRQIGQRNLLRRTVVRIVRTTEAQSFVSWMTGWADKPAGRLRVVRLSENFKLTEIYWDANHKTCYIVYPGDGAETQNLLIVDPESSSVTHAKLVRPDRIVSRAGWTGPVLGGVLLITVLALAWRSLCKRSFTRQVEPSACARELTRGCERECRTVKA